MQPSKVILEFMKKLINEKPVSEQDFMNVIQGFSRNKNMKAMHLCELIRLEYWISWPYARELHNLQHGECKICIMNDNLKAQYEALNLTSGSTVSTVSNQIMIWDLKQASKCDPILISNQKPNILQTCEENNECNSAIGILDNTVRDVNFLVNALATNNIKILKHLTYSDTDYDHLYKCYMKLHFDNASIEMPIRDHIQQLFTEYSYHPKASSETRKTALNFQKCVNNLLQEIISIINNSQWTNVWLIHALHQLTLIAPYHYKNDTVWSQYIYIARQWINDALNNTNYTESPITKKLAKYTAHLLQPNESDKTEIRNDLEETYNAIKNQSSLQRIMTCLKVISNVNCRDLIDQLALLRAIQISGECVKNTSNTRTNSAPTRVTLAPLTDKTQRELINCRNDLSHCVSLPHIDISLLETIKRNLEILHKEFQSKLGFFPEKVINKKVRLRNHLSELGKQLRKAPTELETRMEPIELLQRVLQDISLHEFRKDHRLSAAVATLVLCIFEAIKTTDKLKENKYWILDRFPVLLDRQLRNYLAHSGWFELMPIDETAALYYSARMLIRPDFHNQIQKENGPPGENDWYAAYDARRNRLTMVENFWQALRTNQVAKVNLMVKQDPTLLYSRRLTDHKHALHFAAEGGAAMVRLILDMEGTMEQSQLAHLTDRNGYTVLHIAALTSNHHTVKAVRLYCQKVEPLQQCLRECKTALHLAVNSRKTEVVRELLLFTNNGLHLKDNDGYLALHRAVQLSDLNMVQMLVDGPVDDLLTSKGKTCLYLAAQHGHLNITEYLLELGSEVHQSYNGLTSLHIAVLNEHLPVVELLVRHGAHLNSPITKPTLRAEVNKRNLMINQIVERLNQYKLTSESNYNDQVKIWKALQTGNTVEVKKLLSNSDSINLCICSRDDGKCALHYAIEGRNIDCIRLVIDKCNINARNFKNQTALHTAALYGNLEAAKLLLQKNAALDIFDIDGFLAVHQAIQSNQVEVMNLLIAAHKTKLNNIKTKCKRSCLQLACEYGHGNLVEELLRNTTTGCINDSQISNLLLAAAKAGHLNVATVLLKYGADENIRSKSGESALHIAAGQGNLEMCTLLVNHGAYSEAINNAKQTPRDIAKVNCHGSIVSYLDSVKQDEVQKICQKMQQEDLKFFKNYFRIRPKLLELMRCKNAKTLLHCAVESKSIKMVSFIFREAPALQNVLDGHGQTVLHSAATNKCENDCSKNCTKIILQFILQNCKSVKIELANFRGKTALQLALRARNKQAVTELLNKYKKTPSAYEFLTAMAAFDCSIMASLIKRLENVNQRLMPDGRTLLHLAAKFVCSHSRSNDMKTCCQCSQFMAFLYLLNSEQADVNAQTDYKLTPLHIAARNGNVGVVESLIAKNANVNALADYQTAALILATRHNHTEVTKILVKGGANVNENNWQNRTALYYALCNNNLNIVRILIENGANMKAEYKDVKTSEQIKQYLQAKVHEMRTNLNIFWEAIGNEDLMLVSNLLKNNLFPWTVVSNDNLQNALHIAAGSTSFEIYEFLSCQKQLQNAYHNKDKNGRTVLHISISAGKTEIVDYILNNCPLVNVNDQDNIGFSAAHFASAKNNTIILKMLFDRHANCNLSDQYGNTPLHLAATNGYTDVAKLLLQHGAAHDEFDEGDYAPLHLAAISGNAEIVDILLQYGADVDILGPNNQTPLHAAAMHGQHTAVRMLIKHKALLNMRNSDQETPLHLAALNGHVGLVHTLCEHGSQVEARNLVGNTPLHSAAMNGHALVALALYTIGAKINALNTEDRTPMNVAAMNGHTNLVKILIKVRRIGT